MCKNAGLEKMEKSLFCVFKIPFLITLCLLLFFFNHFNKAHIVTLTKKKRRRNVIFQRKNNFHFIFTKLY